MEHKTLQLSTQQIAYYESAGTGFPIILIHGNSSSGKSYTHQIASSFGEKYRVIAIDLPGHGHSDPASDTATYSMPGYAKIIAEAAEKLDANHGVFVGWSLGGHIALEAQQYLPQAKGFVIFGTPPLGFPAEMEKAFLPHPAMPVGFTPEVTEAQAKAYAASFFTVGKDVPEAFVEDVLKTDGNARKFLGASIQPGGYTDEIEIVKNIPVPLAIFHGKGEQLVSLQYLQSLDIPKLWKTKVQVFEESGHAPHWEQPDAFNEQLDAFVSEINK